MPFSIFARGTGVDRPYERTGISVGEWMDTADYLEYATGFRGSWGRTALQQGSNFVGNQMDGQDEVTANLTSVGVNRLRSGLQSVLIHYSPIHLSFSAHEVAMLLADSSGFWEGELRVGDDPEETLMRGILPILEETNLLCMGVLGGIGDALATWAGGGGRGRGMPRILIQVRSEVVVGDFGPSRAEMRH